MSPGGKPNIMPRPIKCRYVNFIPSVTLFKPAGVPLRMLEEVCLSLEETEAIRLRDLEGLEQEVCAERMKISRPTFHRVLESARRKMADALVNGKAIRIEGGNFQMAIHRFKCTNDNHEWELPSEAVIPGSFPMCPRCNKPGKRHALDPNSDQGKKGWRRHHRGKCVR